MSLKIGNDMLALAANTIRGLAMDGVQKAKSGHPGMPMGMADIAVVLWLKHMNYSPADPKWPDRDRFILSNGHGSMLLYSLLHLSGYDLPLSELESFRQWGSRTPGHPESEITEGVETTTGPLGQGIANGVGMALAERMLASRFNSEKYSLVDHYTYIFCGDGCLMEGISHEACSLAGHLGLNRLILFYDDNRITIEGSTDLSCSDDAAKRFQAYNWNVIKIDAHDYDQVDKAIRKAKRSKDRPTIIICRSHIGKGSPNKVDTAAAHGEPLGDEEVKASKRFLGLPEDKFFYVPDKVRELFQARTRALNRKAASWRRAYNRFAVEQPEKAKEWNQFFSNEIPADIESVLPKFDTATPIATRAAGGKVLQSIAKAVPNLVGGAADLAPSTRTLIEGSASIARDSFSGRNIHFGVREHAMCSIMNGMALHGGFRVFGSTFFVFADYCRPAIRLAALMKLPVIYVFTHDSFYVGEDGPTHEPVEHAASLRCIPGMTVIRPADPTETGAAWVAALKHKEGPVALLLTRQNLAVIDRSKYSAANNLEKGAYILAQTGEGKPGLIIIASGSEVQIALDTAKELSKETVVRVVSMPSWELFEKQPVSYRNEVLPPDCKTRLAIEAGSSFGWERYIGNEGRIIALNRFGASAPYKVLAEKFGFTTANAVGIARSLIAASRK